MITTISGMIGNLSSIIMWFPSAKLTWKYRNDMQALKGVSLHMQFIAIINTLSWFINGVSTHNYYVAFGTVIILPTVIFTIIVKLKPEKKENGENKCQ